MDQNCLPPPYNPEASYFEIKYSPPPYQPADNSKQSVSKDTLITESPPPYCFKKEESPQVKFTTPQHQVVTSQPSSSTLIRTTHVGLNGDYYMTVSLILIVLCVFSCGYIWLFCTLPAFLLSSKALQASSNGNIRKARMYGNLSLGLNAFAIITWIFFWAVVVILSSSFRSSNKQNYYNSYHYNNYYYNYYHS